MLQKIDTVDIVDEIDEKLPVSGEFYHPLHEKN